MGMPLDEGHDILAHRLKVNSIVCAFGYILRI